MSLGWFVVFIIVVLWGLMSLYILLADGRDRRRWQQQLELRDWAEKVEAMKRLQDQEGDA